MILHLGSDCFVCMDDILMILDYEEAVKNQDTGLFLKTFRQHDVCGPGKPKAVVITVEERAQRLYLSPISGKTLLKRSHTWPSL